jgi:hypothetical protein
MKQAIIGNSRAYERQVFEERLRATEKGAVVTYGELSKDLGISAIRLRSTLSQVRQQIAVDGFVFEAVTNVGLRRLTDTDMAVAVPHSRRRRINRQAAMGMREMASIDLSSAELSKEQRATALIGRSLLGAIYAVSTHRAVKQIGQSVAKTGNELPVSATIAAFAGLG